MTRFGFKEKPEDTRYIKRLHRNETRNTGSVGKLNIMDSIPNFMPSLDLIFIECFTTTFLRAHSWLNWVDEDDDKEEVGLKEKPEDTRYIKKITSK